MDDAIVKVMLDNNAKLRLIVVLLLAIFVVELGCLISLGACREELRALNAAVADMRKGG